MTLYPLNVRHKCSKCDHCLLENNQGRQEIVSQDPFLQDRENNDNIIAKQSLSSALSHAELL